MPRRWIIVPAAGCGARFASGLPKQYVSLGGATILSRTIDRMRSIEAEAIIVGIAPGDRHFDEMIGPRAGVEALCSGGATRAATVRNTLEVLSARCADDDWVVVHDAARPCVPRESLARLVGELAGDAVGGLLAVPLGDTLKRSEATAARVMRTEDRSGLWLAQTPQMFRYRLLRAAHALQPAREFTDDAQAIEALSDSGACGRPRLVTGSAANIKVTYPGDLALAVAILDAQGYE